nr:phage tail protein [Bacteroidota bacterium]
NVGSDKIALIANQQAFLRIEADGNLISNEALKHVPYAISANNGVPTGAIMPFIGTVAPPGWVLCNGDAIPDSGAGGAGYDLSTLLGSASAPDLRGFFLRGAGTNAVSGYTSNAGPAIQTRQQDDNLTHFHSKGSLATSSTGGHSHNVPHSAGSTPTAGSVYRSAVNRSTATNPQNTYPTQMPTSLVGNHSHTITGSTGSVGGTESRPVNYGVNYIIKL